MKWLLILSLSILSFQSQAQIQWIDLDEPPDVSVCRQLLSLGKKMLLANTEQGVFFSDKTTISWEPLIHNGVHVSTEDSPTLFGIRAIPGKNDTIIVTIPTSGIAQNILYTMTIAPLLHLAGVIFTHIYILMPYQKPEMFTFQDM